MSFLEDCESAEITKIRGQATLPDEYDRGVWAELARNCEFILNEQVQTRRGFARAFTSISGGPITRMLSWISAGLNRLIYYTNDSGSGVIIVRDLSLGSEAVIAITLAGETADIVSQGATFMFAPLNQSGQPVISTGISQAQVSDGVNWSDVLFTAPLDTSVMTMSATEPAVGTVSKGAHNFAVVFTTRSGYETRPSPLVPGFPASGGLENLRPFTFIATGGLTLEVSMDILGGTWPAQYVSAALLMTTVQNPNRYFFVPGCTIQMHSGTVTFPSVDLPDTVLASSSSTEAVTAAKNYFGLYSENGHVTTVPGIGDGPIYPWKILVYGTRTVYFVTLVDGTSAIFISNPNAPQWITLANHLRQLPGKVQITSGYVLRQTLYIVGPEWTYTFSDNGGLPVTWASPGQVDSHIGTITSYGADANSSLGYAWVAHDTGLYLFTGGYYAARPATYLNTPDWDRVNWAAPVAVIQVKDFPSRKMVLVKVPLDGQPLATHIMAIDYSNGTGWDQVNYSLWDINSLTLHGGIGALELVLNPTARLYELYLSESSTSLVGTSVFRSKSIAANDASVGNPNLLYSDDGDIVSGIDCQFRSCALPKVDSDPNNYAAVKTRVKGNGALGVTAFTLDDTRQQALTDIQAGLTPGRWALNRMDVQSEALHMQYTNKATVQAWFLISGMKVYWDRWLLSR